MGRVPSSEAGTVSTWEAFRGGGSTPVERPEESAGGRQGHSWGAGFPAQDARPGGHWEAQRIRKSSWKRLRKRSRPSC